jgi:hypothetical protein
MQRIPRGSGRDRLLGRRAPAAAGDAKLRDLGARSLPLPPPRHGNCSLSAVELVAAAQELRRSELSRGCWS